MFDLGLSGFIGNLPDRTSDVLRLLCGLNLIAFVMMVSALKPVYVGRFCHTKVTRPGSYRITDTDGNEVPNSWNIEHLRKFYP